MAVHQPRADQHVPYPRLPGIRVLRDFAAAFFTFALVADIAYARTVIIMWQDFASWMLFAGLVAGGLCVLLWLADLALHGQHPQRGPDRRPYWPVLILNLSVLIAALVNGFVHAGDGWTAIVPWGIALSALTCLLMLASAVLSRLARHHRHTRHH